MTLLLATYLDIFVKEFFYSTRGQFRMHSIDFYSERYKRKYCFLVKQEKHFY